MKKKLLVALFIFLCASVLQAKISEVIPTQEIVVTNNNGFAEFKNIDLYSDPGCPLLPSKRYFFLVPPDADLSTCSFTIQGLKEKVLEGNFKVKPALPPYTKDGPIWPENRSIVDGKDINVYSKNEYFPNSYIQDVSVGKLRCYKIVVVRVYFSKYNPITGKMKCITEGEIVLNVSARSVNNEVRYPIPSNFKKLAKNLVINYDKIAPAYNSFYSFTDVSKYIIMTESSIQSSSTKLEELKLSKEGRGFDVAIITESEWGGGTGDAAAENMRNWMQTNYQELSIQYLLIIGSSEPSNGVVPMKTTKGNMDLETDYYYQDLSGDWSSKDAFAEVSAGRIPVYNNDILALDGILEKIIAYENASLESIEWRFNALLAERPFDDKTPGSNMFEQLKTDALDPQGWTYYRIYHDNNGSPDESSCSYDAVKSAWNAGNYGMVEWMTHGRPKGATDIMKSETTPELGSNEHPPFVCMGSCSNGTITNDNNLAYAMLKNAAIATIGATEVTLYDVGKKDNYQNTNHIQGVVYGFGRAIVLDSLSAGDAHDRIISQTQNLIWHNAMSYTLFGCPDVGVYTCKNTTPVNDKVKYQKVLSNNLSINTSNKEHKILRINYTTSQYGLVNLNIYDMKGKLVQKLVNKLQPGNEYSINYNTRNLSTGVYFCSLKLGNESINTEKLIITQ